MPASLFGEMDHVPAAPVHHGHGLEDQRALQLALELSMLGLNESALHHQNHAAVNSSHNNHHNEHHGGGNNEAASYFSNNVVDDLRSLLPKKSQNMTECVPVPSSEHVAEIVGRQGCKIKALRAKTNTYIKTPVRGEEPVFVVTGRKEDVALAKREILSAAEHFSQIRASRKGGNGIGGIPGGGTKDGNGTTNGLTLAPAPIPGQVTIQVRVPYRVVGLVVGPKGATIKRIQQQTHTYIVTPSRDKDPVFEVTGLPDHVQMAKREIEAHIAIRTGSLPMENGGMEHELNCSHLELLANLYKQGGSSGLNLEGLSIGLINSLSSSLSSVSGHGQNNGGGILNGNSGNSAGSNSVGSSSSGGGSLSSLNGFNNCGAGMFGQMTELTGFSLIDNGLMSSSRSEDSYLFGGSGPNSIVGSQTKLSDIFANSAASVVAANNNTNVSVGSSPWGSFDRDEGLGESPTLESAPGSVMWPELNGGLRSSISPPGLGLKIESGAGGEMQRRMSSEQPFGLLTSVTSSGSVSGPSSPTELSEH